MPNPILGTLESEVNQTVGVIESAVALINGFGAKLDAAVAAALANGASEADLQPFTALSQELSDKTDALAAAVAANA